MQPQARLALPLSPPADQRLDPYPFYARMRRCHPVAYDEDTGVWAVYRYDEVRRVLTDNPAFSSDLRRAKRPRFIARDQPPNLINSDGSRHAQLRAPVARHFSAAAVAKLETRVRERAHHLLDRVSQQGHMDVVDDLAGPLPLALIVEIVGVPAEDQATFTRLWTQWLAWRNERSPHQRNNPRKRPGPWLVELDNYIRRLATRKHAEPADDLMSSLVTMEVEGQRLREEEILECFALLLIAAHVTTTHLIANAIFCLLRHPAALDHLRAEPAQIPTALEEVLRYCSPVQAVSRVSVHDVDVGGRTIPAGEEILAWIGSANRDSARFPNPERFDIVRHPNPHIAFGQGSHACFGASLARLQARIALAALLERLPNLEPVEGAVLEPNRNPFLYGPTRLPVRFSLMASR